MEAVKAASGPTAAPRRRKPLLLRPGAKVVVFLLCLLPFAWLLRGAVLSVMGTNVLGANPAEALIRATGDWTLRFLCITLAVTPVRDWFGQPWLVQLRRMLGLYAFFYVLMHFLTWLILDQGLYWSGILKDIGERPFITIGFTALLCLIPLAVTSTNKMMRRLGKRWKSLHRLVYAICLLAVWHYYWQVKADTTEPLIYLAIVLVLLGWRVWKARPRRASDSAVVREG